MQMPKKSTGLIVSLSFETYSGVPHHTSQDATSEGALRPVPLISYRTRLGQTWTLIHVASTSIFVFLTFDQISYCVVIKKVRSSLKKTTECLAGLAWCLISDSQSMLASLRKQNPRLWSTQVLPQPKVKPSSEISLVILRDWGWPNGGWQLIFMTILQNAE